MRWSPKTLIEIFGSRTVKPFTTPGRPAKGMMSLSFGSRPSNEEDPPNTELAKLVDKRCSPSQLPAAVQWEIAQRLPPHFYQVFLAHEHRKYKWGFLRKILPGWIANRIKWKKKFFNSNETIAQLAEWFLSRGIRDIAVLGHDKHVWRVVHCVKRHGLNVVEVVDGSSVPCDPSGRNLHPWVSDLETNHKRETIACIGFWVYGWI